jgi:Ca2+-binding EF-hand superfamily protein
MGADGSKMGVTAMSIVSGIQKEDIDKLRSSFQTFADRAGGNKDVSREESDAELLDKLFVLLDETGENKVDIKDFLVASSLLVNYATAKDKLKFAFTIFDDGETGSIFALDCRKVLTTINLTGSFFGDAVLSTGDIKDLIDAIWLECSIPSAPMTYLDHLDFIVNHEISVRFCSGQGTVRFEN